MAMNQRYTHFDHIALTVPDGVKSGQPVRVGAYTITVDESAVRMSAADIAARINDYSFKG